MLCITERLLDERLLEESLQVKASKEIFNPKENCSYSNMYVKTPNIV